jgi:hypothetical protein
LREGATAAGELQGLKAFRNAEAAVTDPITATTPAQAFTDEMGAIGAVELHGARFKAWELWADCFVELAGAYLPHTLTADANLLSELIVTGANIRGEDGSSDLFAAFWRCRGAIHPHLIRSRPG